MDRPRFLRSRASVDLDQGNNVKTAIKVFARLSFAVCCWLFTAGVPASARSEKSDVSQNGIENPAAFFQLFDLGRTDLAEVKVAVAAQNWDAALEQLLHHFAQSKRAEWVLRLARQDRLGSRATADAVLKDVFTLTGSTGKIRRDGEGHVLWLDRGPNDDVEWAYFLNRHYYFRDLHAAYSETKDERYADAYASLLRDWLRSNPAPSAQSNDAAWRVLEVGIRMSEWPAAFYGFQQREGFTPALRAEMLSAMAAQAEYLTKFATKHHNHASMEMHGLANVALCFPEFAQSEKWFQYARAGIEAEAAWQVYPDGVQNELAAGYHVVSLNYFRRFAALCDAAGRDVATSFRETIARMIDYLALTVEPLGFRPANNDSDHVDIRPQLLSAADQFRREDWRFAATAGASGRAPASPASRFFPWAGQFVMRDGWSSDAQWSFFDVGHWGWAHQHHDMLHLSLSASGRRFLVDGGRYHYRADKWRWYFALSSAHNVILVDGKGQNATAPLSESPVAAVTATRPEFDFALARFDAGFGDNRPAREWDGDYKGSGSIPGSHERAVLYLRNRFWIVIDRVRTDRPRKMTMLWHFHPDCSVVALPDGTKTNDRGLPNLTLQTVSPSLLHVSLARGREEPSLQGWFSPTYGSKVPATCAMIENEGDAEFVSASLIQITPANAEARPARITKLEFHEEKAELLINDGTKKLRVVVRLGRAKNHEAVCLIDGLSEQPQTVSPDERAGH